MAATALLASGLVAFVDAKSAKSCAPALGNGGSPFRRSAPGARAVVCGATSEENVAAAGLKARRRISGLRRWNLGGNSCESMLGRVSQVDEQVQSVIIAERKEPAHARATPREAAPVTLSILGTDDSSSRTSNDRPSVRTGTIPANDVIGSDPPNGAHCDGLQSTSNVCEEYIGVQPVRGRFEVKLQNVGVTNTLVFSSPREAAKAFDKVAYKLSGTAAETNFRLTEEEIRDVQGMKLEELLLSLQLNDLAQTAPPILGYPGVCYKDEERIWMVKVRHKNQNYVGSFQSMTEATKAYDLAVYKLRGRNAILSQPLSSSEKVELMHKDWDTLTTKLGLRIQAPRKKRSRDSHGVRHRPAGKWLASFSHKGHYVYLGTFTSKKEAAKAYDLFASKILGSDAMVNSQLRLEEEEFVSTMSLSGLRDYLASQALIAPKQKKLGARGVRLVQGQWEVFLEDPRKDRMYRFSAADGQEAQRVHDLLEYKLHNGMGRSYTDLTTAEQREVESADWSALKSKFDLQHMPSYRGVNRLVSGVWQSFIRHGGAYLAIATFDSPEAAARASDKCQYKLHGLEAILNFPIADRQKEAIDAVDWSNLIVSIRAEQPQSAVSTELGGSSAVSSPYTSSDKKWMLLLCREQLLQQQISRRAPKVGRQLVVANPSLATQFSHFNRRADESRMLVEEVMEGSNTPLLWTCPCGNITLKTPMGLLKVRQVVCKMAGCTVTPPSPIRMDAPMKKKKSKPDGVVNKSSQKQTATL